MWQRFTESARRVVFFAQGEAGNLGTNCISSEHLLLGIVREEESIAARILDRLHVGLPRLRHEVERFVQKADGKVAGDMQLSPQGKRVIDLAHEESQQMGENFIGTEHLLVGLIREEEGLASRVLLSLGVELESVRTEIIAIRSLAAAEKNASAVETAKAAAAESAATASTLSLGDLGKVAPIDGRAHAEVALDLTAFLRLRAVFEVKDAHGYRAMAEGDQTMFLLPTGTPLKLLAPPADSKVVHNDGFYVRVLSGEYEGYAGWIFKEVFERTGADDAPFPPALKGNA